MQNAARHFRFDPAGGVSVQYFEIRRRLRETQIDTFHSICSLRDRQVNGKSEHSISQLPSLTGRVSMQCNVCESTSDLFATTTILNHHKIKYYQCSSCRFVQTEEPYWLDEAYNNAIISTDVGLIARNEKFATATSRLLNSVITESTKCVDYGGGYGMMTRMMRDRGHDFRHLDPYCDNLFAKSFEWTKKDGRSDLLTAFEVWEHLASPLDDISRMDSLAENWLFSTELLPDDNPRPGQWWYYALDGGQHVSIWTSQSLQHIAKRFSRHYMSPGYGLHLMTRRKLSRRWVRWAMFGKSSRWLSRLRKKKSLTQLDYQAALRRAA